MVLGSFADIFDDLSGKEKKSKISIYDLSNLRGALLNTVLKRNF